MKPSGAERLVSLVRQLRYAWRLAGPYFASTTPTNFNAGWLGVWRLRERLVARTLLACILTLEICQVCLSVLLNAWNARFFNAIQDKSVPAFWRELVVFVLIGATFAAIAAYQIYFTQWLHIRWRAWMTDRYLDRWLMHGVHYRMRLRGEPADNPDQRIAEDVEMFVDRSLSLGIGLLSASMTLVSFVVILWGLSTHLTFPMGSSSIAVPGLLVWTALIFAIVGTFGAHRIGWNLIGLNFTKQRYEADFRYALVRLRESSEQVALARGEGCERDLLAGRFANVAANWHSTMRRQKALTFFTTGYNQVSVVLPTILVAPHYFAGLVSLGTLTQTGAAFGQVQTAFSFFVNAYARLAQWKSVVDRLVGFETQMTLATGPYGELHATRNGKIETPLTIEDVDLHLPSGQPLLTGARLAVRRGEAVLLTGPSGSGKSTLFRAVGAIWPHARGQVTLAPDARLLVLSQRPYFPLGSLAAALAYPGDRATEQREVHDTLAKVGLGDLGHRVGEIAPWGEVLSPGEQQRLAFGRVLINRPDVVLLDEATSALDEPAEAELYRLLRAELPALAILSAGHRSTLTHLHDRTLPFASYSKPSHSGCGQAKLPP